jgi:hypothetical protein
MTERDPYSGEPYYCAMCGLGPEDQAACTEKDDCRLESKEIAIARQIRRRAKTTAKDS